jgi:hypothetical protein
VRRASAQLAADFAALAGLKFLKCIAGKGTKIMLRSKREACPY